MVIKCNLDNVKKFILQFLQGYWGSKGWDEYKLEEEERKFINNVLEKVDNIKSLAHEMAVWTSRDFEERDAYAFIMGWCLWDGNVVFEVNDDNNIKTYYNIQFIEGDLKFFPSYPRQTFTAKLSNKPVLKKMSLEESYQMVREAWAFPEDEKYDENEKDITFYNDPVKRTNNNTTIIRILGNNIPDGPARNRLNAKEYLDMRAGSKGYLTLTRPNLGLAHMVNGIPNRLEVYINPSGKELVNLRTIKEEM